LKDEIDKGACGIILEGFDKGMTMMMGFSKVITGGMKQGFLLRQIGSLTEKWHV
jgi:hypothetical protein